MGRQYSKCYTVEGDIVKENMRKEDMQTEGFFYIFSLYYILGGLPVKKLVSLLLAAMMLVTMMGGCAGKDAEKPASAPADTTTAEKPEEKKDRLART